MFVIDIPLSYELQEGGIGLNYISICHSFIYEASG